MMIIRKLSIAWIIGAVTLLAVVLIIFKNTPERRRKPDRNISEFIDIENFGEKILVVKLGSDAVTAVLTQKGIVIIDAGISYSLTKKYRKVIKARFKSNDFAYLINTHSHTDHTGGNEVFSKSVIIGHKNCLNELSDYGKEAEKIKSRLFKIVNDYDKMLERYEQESKEWVNTYCQKIRYQYAYNDFISDHRITPPSVTFDDSLQIDLGDIRMDTFYFGKAHSDSDIIIHFPELRLLMTGDLFFKGGISSVKDTVMKDLAQWGKAIQWISSRFYETDIVIGGHGDIMDQGDLQTFILSVKKMSGSI